MADNVDRAVEDYLREQESNTTLVPPTEPTRAPSGVDTSLSARPLESSVDASVAEYLEELKRPPTIDTPGGEETIVRTVPPIPQRKALRMDELDLQLRKAAVSDTTMAAKQQELARKLNTEPEALPPGAEERVFLQSTDSNNLIDKSPAVASFLLRKGNAELVGKNVDKLQDIDSTFRRIVVDPLISVGKTVTAIPQAVLGLSDITNAIVMPWVNLVFPPEKQEELKATIGGEIPEVLADALFKKNPHAGLKAAQEELASLYSPEQKIVNRQVQQAEGFVDTLAEALASPSFIAHSVIESLGPMLLGAAGARALVQQQAGKVSATLASAVGEGSVMAGSQASKIVEEQKAGLTTGQLGAVTTTGVVGGAIGFLGSRVLQKLGVDDVDVMLARGTLEQAAKTSGMPLGVSSRVLLGATGEGLQELSQSAIETIAENVATGKPWDENVPESMALGLVTGAAMGGPSQAIARPVSGLPAGELPEGTPDVLADAMIRAMNATHAEVSRTNLKEFSDRVATNELRENAPEAFRAFVRDMVEEGDDTTLTELYVHPEVLKDVLNQSGMTTQEIEQRLPDLVRGIQEAEAVEGDVRVPVEDYATYLAGTKGDTLLLDNARVRPEGMTYAESQEYFQKQEAELTEQARRLLETEEPVLTRQDFESSQEGAEHPRRYEDYIRTHKNKAEAFAVDTRDVHDKILEGLEGAGRFTRSVNAAYAIPFRQFYAVNAARMGVLPSELYERFPLNFQKFSIPGGLEQSTTETAPVPAATSEDFTPEKVGNILQKGDWMLLTGWNPEAREATDEENAAANDRLKQDLLDRGLKFDEVWGMYPGDTKEAHSFLVYGADRQTALEMARAYRQDSVLVREGFIYQNGSFVPNLGVSVFTTPEEGLAAGGYTRIPATGTVFSIKADFKGKSYIGRHYTHERRSVLSGMFSMRGLPGADNERVRLSTDRRIRRYLDFYVDTGAGITPEAGLGKVAYDVQLNNIYDGENNPDGFPTGSFSGDDLNKFESAVLDAGYNGYFTSQGKQGRIRLLGGASMEVSTGDTDVGRGDERFLSIKARQDSFARESDGSLQGLPRQIGEFQASHWPKAEEVARAYMKRAGLVYDPPNRFVKVNKERAKRIAKAFSFLRHRPHAPEVREAYDAMIRETIEQYRAIIDSGLQVEFITGEDPYAGNPRAMTDDVRNNNHMWVYSTRDGFGTDQTFDPADNPLLAETEFEISGQVALANDLFRVVHDYFGHVKEGVGFRADGEENAWRAHVAMYSPLAARAMTTETRGQNSWVNFGPHAEHNRTASAADTIYADQKVDLMPEWVSMEGARDEDDLFFQFAGPKAATADTMGLADAMTRIAQGQNREQIRQETGWFQGPDGKWRFEIDDTGATLRLDNGSARGPLGDYLFHPRLFEAYPLLRHVFVDIGVAEWLDEGGGFDPRGNGAIQVQAKDKEMALSVLLHEIQHGIQSIEGFAMGGNPTFIWAHPEKFIDKATREFVKSHPGYKAAPTEEAKLEFLRNYARNDLGSAFGAYQRLAGEVEARNVQRRQALGAVGRKLTPPSTTADVPPGMVIVRFNGQDVEEAPLPFNALSTQDVLYQSTFYSALERNIGGLAKLANKIGDIKTAQAKAWVEARQKEGKFKKEEIEAVGLLDWLELQGDTVSVDSVITFVQKNGVQVRDVIVGGPTDGFIPPTQRYALRVHGEVRDGGTVFLDYTYDRPFGGLGYAGRIVQEYDTKGNLVSAEVHRSDDDPVAFDTVEEAEQYLDEISKDSYDADTETQEIPKATKFDEFTESGGVNYKELALVLPPGSERVEIVEEVRRLENGRWGLFLDGQRIQSFRTEEAARSSIIRGITKQEGVLYRTLPGHSISPEADINRLAHVRFNDRTGTDGSSILFLEEIQSDWAQEVRKFGFTETAPKAPFVGDTRAWVALSLKRMVRYAVENGYDRVAWTTGRQQADRYSLRKTIKRVSAFRMDEDRNLYDLTVELKSGTVRNFSDIPEVELAGHVGVELAKKITEHQHGPEADKGAHFTDMELDVGGEGMMAFYDNIIPQVANDILKKLKGGRVDVRTVEGLGEQQGFDITPELRETVMQGLPLFQGERASFNPTTFTISLLDGADLSSVLHEGGHFYLEALAGMASQTGAPEQIRNDFLTTLNWFGVSEADWGVMTLEEKRPYHEQWAQSWERYALEGKAPTLEMQPVFARFRTWLLDIYKSLKEFLQHNPLADKLNDDVRAVFDRLLAAEDAITKAETARGYTRIFDTAEQAGVSQREFDRYLEQETEATEAALTELATRSLRDMKWLSGAKTRAINDLQKQANALRRVIKAEVTQEVMSEPVNRAISLLKDNRVMDDNGDMHEAPVEVKLDLAEIQTTMPNVDLRRLRGMTAAEGGLSLQEAANLFGFTGGEALINALLGAENVNDKIKGLTDQRMMERHGDLIDERAVENAANAAVHNEARARFMATGLKMLTKSPVPAAQLNKAAKNAAEATIATKKIRDLSPAQYARAEQQANKRVLELAPRDTEGAIVAQRSALLNNRLAKAALEAKSEVDRMVAYLNKFRNATTRKNIRDVHLEQIDDLLATVNLRKGETLRQIDKNKSLADWVEEQTLNGFEPALDTSLLEELKRKHFKDMTVEELRGLTDSIKQIEHIGRLEKRLLTAKDRREFQTRIAEAELSIRDNANRTAKERGTPTDVIGIVGQFGRQFLAAHRKFSSVIREMDGGKDGGVMWQLLSRGMNEAGNTETEMNQKAAKELAKLFAGIPKENRIGNIYARKRNIPGTNISLTQENRIMFALNWGNLGNRQRLLDGGVPGQRALTQSEADKILDTLTKEEWDFAQGVWDYFETYREAVGELERKLTGVTPKWVEPAPVETKFGTYRGGYFPAKYDTELSTRSAALEAATDLRMGMQGAFGSSATRNSFAKERSEKVINRPILLNYNSISNHVSEVIHRLAWQPWLTDANRVLRALDGVLREHYGSDILREMRLTVEDIAKGDAGAKDAVERALNHLRSGSTIAAMGWRVSTAVMQPTGLAQSWSRIGARWAAVGVAKSLANPVGEYRFVTAKSSFMKNRTNTMQREINDILNQVRSGEGLSNVTTSFFVLMGKMQMAVDLPTWLGAYEKGLHDLKYQNAVNENQRRDIEEEAVARADQAVLDSQSGGQIKDLARVQRGSPAQKLFTMFYSYFSATYNLNVEAIRRTSFKSPTQLASFAADMLIINVVPVLMAVALREMMRGKCEIDDTECLAERYVEEQMGHLFGQMVLLRELSSAGAAMVGGETFGYQGPSGVRFFADVYKAGVQYGQGDVDWPAVKSTLNVMGSLLHWPTGQIVATTEGIMAVENGEVEGVSILPALLFGPPKD